MKLKKTTSVFSPFVQTFIMYMYYLQELWGSIWHFYIVLVCLIRTDSEWSTILPLCNCLELSPLIWIPQLRCQATMLRLLLCLCTESSQLYHIYFALHFLSTNNFLLSLRQLYLLVLYSWQICFLSYVYSILYLTSFLFCQFRNLEFISFLPS